jgi:hypothetical protein
MQERRGLDWKTWVNGNGNNKIKVSEINGPVQPIRIAPEAFKLYFDGS